MFVFAILVPTTAIIAGGYIILVFSQQTEGRLRSFGKNLATWIFILAGLFFIGSTAAGIYRVMHNEVDGLLGGRPSAR